MSSHSFDLAPNFDDRVAGTLHGQAIGDALGLGTEFMSREEVSATYPDVLRCYADIVRDTHRARWPVGAWTDDTEQALCVLDRLLARGQLDVVDIARRLREWTKSSGLGIGRTVQRAMDRDGFDTNPVAAARQAWEDGRARLAANGGVMRATVVGLSSLGSADDSTDVIWYVEPGMEGGAIAKHMAEYGMAPLEKYICSGANATLYK